VTNSMFPYVFSRRFVRFFQAGAVFSLAAALPMTRPIFAAGASATSTFRIESQWPIGGEGGWGFLALDSEAHRLYIPRTNRVMVVDTESGKLEGEVQGIKNSRAITLDDSGRYGYVTDPTDGTAGFLRIFDRSSLALVASVPTGLVPAAVVFDAASKQVLAFNSHSHSVTVVDSGTRAVVATIPLPARPGAAVGDGRGHAFVALPAAGEIVRIDAMTNAVTATWALGPCTGPAQLAIDSVHDQLLTTCEDHKLAAVDMETGAMNEVGDAPANPGDMGFDRKHGWLLIADAGGMLTVLTRDAHGNFSALQRLPTAQGARTMIFDPERDKGYLVSSKFGQNVATASEELRYRPTPVPGTFSVMVVAP